MLKIEKGDQTIVKTYFTYFKFLSKVLMKRKKETFSFSSLPTFRNQNLSHNYTYLPFATLFLWENTF